MNVSIESDLIELDGSRGRLKIARKKQHKDYDSYKSNENIALKKSKCKRKIHVANANMVWVVA